MEKNSILVCRCCCWRNITCRCKEDFVFVVSLYEFTSYLTIQDLEHFIYQIFNISHEFESGLLAGNDNDVAATIQKGKAQIEISNYPTPRKIMLE